MDLVRQGKQSNDCSCSGIPFTLADDGEFMGWPSNTFLDKLHHNIPKQATTILKCSEQ
jgi:electron transfer flavoprotein alpha/beta subunit